MKEVVQYIDPDSFFVRLQIDFACTYGVNVAILTGKMYRLEKELQGRIDESGNKWIRMTAEEWCEELPFFSERTIWTVIKEATDQEILFTRTFKGRSKWYRLNPKYIACRKSCDMQLADAANPTRKNGGLPRESSYTSIHEEDSRWSQIVHLWENNIGLLSPLMAQEMQSDQYLGLPPAYWQQAIEIALANSAPKWAYVRACLDWAIQNKKPPKERTFKSKRKGKPNGHSNITGLKNTNRIQKRVDLETSRTYWYDTVNSCEVAEPV